MFFLFLQCCITRVCVCDMIYQPYHFTRRRRPPSGPTYRLHPHSDARLTRDVTSCLEKNVGKIKGNNFGGILLKSRRSLKLMEVSGVAKLEKSVANACRYWLECQIEVFLLIRPGFKIRMATAAKIKHGGRPSLEGHFLILLSSSPSFLAIMISKRRTLRECQGKREENEKTWMRREKTTFQCSTGLFPYKAQQPSSSCGHVVACPWTRESH